MAYGSRKTAEYMELVWEEPSADNPTDDLDTSDDAECDNYGTHLTDEQDFKTFRKVS